MRKQIHQAFTQPRTQALLPTPGAAAKTLVLFGHVLPRIWEVAKFISQGRVDKSKFCHTQIRDAKFVRLLLKFHLILKFSCCIHEIKIYLRQCLHISIKLHIYGIRLPGNSDCGLCFPRVQLLGFRPQMASKETPKKATSPLRQIYTRNLVVFAEVLVIQVIEQIFLKLQIKNC